MFDNLLVEKYRPHTLEDIILTEDNRELVEKFKAQDEISHLLFLGPPGIGKTSLAKIIVNDVLKCQYLTIIFAREVLPIPGGPRKSR